MHLDKAMSQYMSQLKVNLHEAYRTQVSSNWGEKSAKNDYAKLYYILSGEGYITIDDKVYHPKAGDVIYIPDGHKLSFGNIGPRYYDKYWCHFNADIGTSPLYEMIDFPLMFKAKDREKYELYFKNMCQAYHAVDALSPIQANAQLMLLIHHFLYEVEKEYLRLRHQVASTTINQLLEYMEKSIDQKLTIDDLVQVANLHPIYLIRYFKMSFGTTPIAYFNRLKIERAKALLSIKGESIKNIAAALGYSTPYYFSTTFKKQTGFTPTEYRKYRLTMER